MIGGVAFDHLAVAAPRRADLVQRYGGDLGGAFVVEGPTAGLTATIVKFANGVKLEAIEPDLSSGEDFLARFLARHGPGVHHVTFVVPDLEAAADATEAAGFTLMGSRTAHLQEVFVHPKDASGIVVQFVEERRYRGTAPPEHPLPAQTAVLDHMTMVVASLDGATRLFVDLLGGEVTGRDDDAADRYLDLSWPGPGTIRVLEPAPGTELHDWLAGRSGAVHHLALHVEDPGAVPDATETGGGTWEVHPDANHGVRLVIQRG